MSFQKTVFYQYATGLPGEIIADGPLRARSFRLVANTLQTPNPPIAFGVGFTYAALGDVSNPNNLADTPTATPGGAPSGTNVFAGILINPKEHALYGDANGALDPVFALPDGSWGELCHMGILLALVSSGAAATEGVAGNKLAMKLADGSIWAYGAAANLPAGSIEIPGASLLTGVGANAAGVLAKIELTGLLGVAP